VGVVYHRMNPAAFLIGAIAWLVLYAGAAISTGDEIPPSLEVAGEWWLNRFGNSNVSAWLLTAAWFLLTAIIPMLAVGHVVATLHQLLV
jgi:hypothetical protein